jgi:hypothetical protein
MCLLQYFAALLIRQDIRDRVSLDVGMEAMHGGHLLQGGKNDGALCTHDEMYSKHN